MSAVEDWAWDTPTSGSAKLVLLRLAKHADWDTLECYPSQRFIAEKTGLSERCVRTAMKELEDGAFILREKRQDEGLPDLVTINAPHLAHPPANSVRPPRQKMSYPPADSADKQTLNPQKRTKTPAGAGDLFGEEQEDPPAAQGQVTLLYAIFDRWYGIYPLKKARGAAERAFKTAMKHVAPEVLFERTERFAALAKDKDKAFLPHPATWLNQKRWDDEELLEAKPAMRLGADDWQ